MRATEGKKGGAVEEPPRPLGTPRQQLVERLQARREEIEGELLTRVHAVQEVPHSAYADGLRAAVSAGLDYALAGIETGEAEPGPVPVELLAQVRLAVREQVGLDTVLRRYLLSHTVIGDFVMSEAEEIERLDHEDLQRLLRVQATLVDRLIAAIAEEYRRLEQARIRTTEQRRATRVKQLLAGDLVDPAPLRYDLGLHHVGLVAAGPGAREVLRHITTSLDCQRLSVSTGLEGFWAWIGSEAVPPVQRVLELACVAMSPDVAVAIGEAGQGLAGWRLTHRQAEAGLAVASQGPNAVVRYAEVALLATALRDDVLASTLRRDYLEPLSQSSDGGVVLRRTLRAYFAAGRNASSASAELGITRQTVNERLGRAEERLGRSIDRCLPELDTALRLFEFSSGA
jgi:hypothetical protein